jgi:hypothetical protein
MGMMLALMLVLVASPAPAAIERFTDNKGTLHITNSNREKVRPEERDEETSSPAQALPGKPAVVQPPPEAEQPEPAPEPAEREKPQPNSYLTVHKGVIRITNVDSKPVKLAQPPAAPPLDPGAAAEAPAAPFTPVAFRQGPSAPAALSLKPTFTGAVVKSYRDRKGVIHITNAPVTAVPQNHLVAGWSSPAKAWGASEAPPGFKPAGTMPIGKQEQQEPLALRRASLLASDSPGLPLILPTSAGGPRSGSATAANAKVRRFRDGKGVIHIVGKGSAPPDLPLASQGIAQSALSQAHTGPPAAWPEPTVALRQDKQGRLVIRNAPRGTARGGDKEEICRQLAPMLMEAAFLYGLPVSLIEAVIKVESNFQPAAVSPKGAMGLMQLMPGTAKFLGVENAFSPRENILGGTRYLRLLLDFFGQSLPLALAAYNAGFQRVIDAGCQVPNLKETQDFVTKVMGHYHLREKQRLPQRLIL